MADPKGEEKVAEESTTTVEPTPVKVGDKEYTQEELSKLVGLGETANEYETKWNRPIGEFYPDYTQKSQRLAELEKAEKVRQDAELSKKQEEGTLSREEQREIARQEAKELGLMTDDVFDTKVNERVEQILSGRELLQRSEGLLASAGKDGKPTTSVDKLLGYMKDEGIRNPEAAYKLMFEKELDAWKADKVNGIKEPGMTTQETSTAGAKIPPPPPTITKETLSGAINASLTRGGRG